VLNDQLVTSFHLVRSAKASAASHLVASRDGCAPLKIATWQGSPSFGLHCHFLRNFKEPENHVLSCFIMFYHVLSCFCFRSNFCKHAESVYVCVNTQVRPGELNHRWEVLKPKLFQCFEDRKTWLKYAAGWNGLKSKTEGPTLVFLSFKVANHQILQGPHWVPVSRRHSENSMKHWQSSGCL